MTLFIIWPIRVIFANLRKTAWLELLADKELT